MVFDRVEQLKRDYTDKFVVVDGARPELARFKGFVGRVKTVNMSGRALVEFDAYANIGWFDIEVDFLKVVDRPLPKVPEKKPEKQPAAKPAPAAKAPASGAAPAAPAAGGEKKLSPLEMARMQGAAGGKKTAAAPASAAAAKPAAPLSTADILAAARTKKGESSAPATAPPAASPKPAAPVGPAAAVAPGAKVDRSKLSVTDMLAIARGQKPAAPPADDSGGAAPKQVEPAAAAPAEVKPAPAKPAATAPVAVAPRAAATPAAAPVAAEKKSSGGDRPKAGELNTEQILAWCRAHDAKQ